MRIQTRNAGWSKDTHPTMFEPENTRVVLVDGVPVGHYGKNKYGVTIGHFDPLAVAAAENGENPFVVARSTHNPYPAARRLGRTVRELVADIANRVPAHY